MQSFYFYDLETSGVNPRTARPMQFAGQRTDLDLRSIGEPHNIMIRLADDILPEPDAVLITGITPQQTRADGMSEDEFIRIFNAEIATPGTIFVGYNTIRFDDEFMRYTMYRNLYEPYEWQWKDHRSRWDLLDVVRMTRALRPEGIEWPFAPDGKPSNRLELLTHVNGLDHQNAHDALSDVNATIAVAKLLKEKQPKLFQYLLSMRTKQKVQALVEANEPFVYASGKYAGEFEKTTVAVKIGDHPKKTGALVYDLRFDPEQFMNLTAEQLAEAWQWSPDKEKVRLPIKTLQYNRCPAVAPLVVLDEDSQQRLHIDMHAVRTNLKKLRMVNDWPGKLYAALDILDKAQQARLFVDTKDVDAKLYDGFIVNNDRNAMQTLHTLDPAKIDTSRHYFKDERLNALLPLFKARNYPESLTDDERASWHEHCVDYLMSGGKNSRLAKYFARLQELSTKAQLTQQQRFLLEDLQLYGESLVPVD